MRDSVLRAVEVKCGDFELSDAGAAAWALEVKEVDRGSLRARVEWHVGWRGQSGGGCVCVVRHMCGPAYVWSGICVCVCVCVYVCVWTGTCADWHITRRSAAAVGNPT